MGNVQVSTISDINKIVTDTTTNVLQRATTDLSESQELDFTCDHSVLEALSRSQYNCWRAVAGQWESGKVTPEQVVKLCQPILCVGDNVSISGSIFARVLCDLDSSTIDKIRKSIGSNLRSYASQQSDSILPALSLTLTNIDSVSKSTTDTLTSVKQECKNTFKQDQLIHVGNMAINHLSQKAVSNFVSKSLLSSSDYNSSVAKLASDIVASTSVSRKSSIKKTFFEVLGVIIALVVICVVAWLIQRYKKKKKKR